MKIKKEKRKSTYNFIKSPEILKSVFFNIHKNTSNEVKNKEQNNNNYIIINKKIISNENKNCKKQINYFINKKLYFRKEFIILCYIILNIITSSFSSDNIQLKYSSITLKINKTGYISIFGQTSLCKSASPSPNEVYINGYNKTELTTKYYLNETENIIKLIWKNDITKAGCMFYSCSNITEIDFSEFNASQVTYMEYMFHGCSSLISIDLSNFNNNLVTSMSYMFYGCSSLTSIDLSNFNQNSLTSMSYMFNRCSNLTFANFSNFNTSQLVKMDYLFYSCSKLISVDLSFLYALKANDMTYMFNGCSSLISLDLSHFDT